MFICVWMFDACSEHTAEITCFGLFTDRVIGAFALAFDN